MLTRYDVEKLRLKIVSSVLFEESNVRLEVRFYLHNLEGIYVVYTDLINNTDLINSKTFLSLENAVKYFNEVLPNA